MCHLSFGSPPSADTSRPPFSSHPKSSLQWNLGLLTALNFHISNFLIMKRICDCLSPCVAPEAGTGALDCEAASNISELTVCILTGRRDNRFLLVVRVALRLWLRLWRGFHLGLVLLRLLGVLLCDCRSAVLGWWGCGLRLRALGLWMRGVGLLSGPSIVLLMRSFELRLRASKVGI